MSQVSIDLFKHYSQALNDHISQHSYILDLQYDWDGSGALPISQDLWNRTAHFLKNVCRVIVNTWGIDMYKPLLPSIQPCADGTIDLFWAKPHILINIESATASFYSVGPPRINGTFDPKNPYDVDIVATIVLKTILSDRNANKSW